MLESWVQKVLRRGSHLATQLKELSTNEIKGDIAGAWTSRSLRPATLGSCDWSFGGFFHADSPKACHVDDLIKH